MNKTKLITDLTGAQPHDALAAESRKGRWRISSYVSQGIEGKLLYADCQAEAPEVTLALGLTGWHRVTVGLWGPSEGFPYSAAGNRLKLSGEPAFRPLVRRGSVPGGISHVENIEEFVLGSANLSGQHLVIGPPAAGSGAVTAVAYVRCEPLSDRQVKAVVEDRARSDCRRIIAYNDGLSFYGRRDRWEKQDFWEMIEPYRHSDVESLYFGLLGDVTCFPARNGTMAQGPGAEKFRSLMDRGIHPVVTAMEYAHQMGLKFFIYQRMGAWADPFPDDMWCSDFTRAHPQFRCISKEGLPITQMSYAFSEVRRRQIDLLSEVASLGVDGVDLTLMRGPAYVLYEEPLVNGFKEQFGQDPRQLDEWDPRWLEYRRWPMTAFLMELRQELDKVGAKLDKRLEISAVTLPTALGNLFYGLDVETWVNERLVDRLVPWGFVRGMPPVDLAYYGQLTEGSATSFWPHLSITGDGWGRDQNAYRREALACYDAGARGLALWDLLIFDGTSVTGPLFRQMGHVDQMRADLEAGTQTEPVLRPVEKIGDVHLTVRSVPATHRARLIADHYQSHMAYWPS